MIQKKTSFLIAFYCLAHATLLFAQPISLHPDNPHYFLYHDKPLVLVTSAEHYGAVVNSAFDTKSYLQTLSHDGLNYTRIFVGPYVEGPTSHGIKQNTLGPQGDHLLLPWKRSDEPGYKLGGNKFDFSQWDEAYFARLKEFVATAATHGVIVEITLFSSSYTDAIWEMNVMASGNHVNALDRIDRQKVHTLDNGNLLEIQEKMVRKIVSELNDFDNVFYEMQNEPYADNPGYVHTLNLYGQTRQKWQGQSVQAAATSVAWQKRVVDWISDQESKLPKRHLIAQNYCNFLAPLPEIDPRIDILNFHYAWPEAVTQNYGFNRPISFDESGFAGKHEDIYRPMAWRFLLAGGSVFNNLDYSFVVGQEDGTATQCNSIGFGSPKLRKQLGVLKRFIEGLDFVNLAPDRHTVVHAPGLTTWTLSQSGKSYAMFIEGTTESKLCKLHCNLPAGQYHLKWYNTLTGEILASQKVQAIAPTTSLQYQDFQGEIALSILRQE